ncbi:DEAD-box ATP-dependent RNA helicase 57-like [Vigna umbellata]|uniref:DEAD-box ATP-dependent RNA helicase 57-like n=1 Tax=Vigna umbellata TaxID=87088 RepID=UPI001F5EBD39|nr:DEAD-box ATP-dependent RNA helicase 57-like [Vigna umbellata]
MGKLATNDGNSNVHEEEEAQWKLFWYSHHLALFTLFRLLYSKFRTSLLLRFRKPIKENVEGFNVFRNYAFVAQSSGEVQADQQSIELSKKKNKKEQNRQLERDAILRKQHNIHVSGYNVLSPLQSFGELKSRYLS